MRFAALLMLVVLVAGACAAGKSAAADDAYGRALTGLCVARDQAGRTPTRVRATFFDRSHGTLHVLARALENVDRSATARVLETMNRVEVDLAALIDFGAAIHVGDLPLDHSKIDLLTPRDELVFKLTPPQRREEELEAEAVEAQLAEERAAEEAEGAAEEA